MTVRLSQYTVTNPEKTVESFKYVQMTLRSRYNMDNVIKVQTENNFHNITGKLLVLILQRTFIS